MFVFLPFCIQSDIVKVANETSLHQAIANARPGTEIVIAMGNYGSVSAANIRGTKEQPIVIRGESRDNPPTFVRWHLSQVENIVIRDLQFRASPNNGLNIDDGGTEQPSRHIRLERLRVSDLPTGNYDGIKLSGVEDFQIVDCLVERWGGSAIDMVGCHRGTVINCTFRTGGDNGVQAKGGSSDIRIVRSRFENPGNRGVNLGGSTGKPYFRPKTATWEARNLSVEGCTFIGAVAAIAFVGVDGAVVRYNTIFKPRRWAIRILQETTDQAFVPCRDGRFENNLVAFERGWSTGGVNIGPNTAPETFRFANNFWFCIDDPTRSRPQLPTPEQNGLYGLDPLFVAPEQGNLNVRQNSPAQNYGAHAYRQEG